MQLRLVSSPYQRLPQRVEPAEGLSARTRSTGEEAAQQPFEQASTFTDSRPVPANAAADSARREYYYSRIEAVAGRTAQALKSYTDVEDGPGREQLQSQLGLDIYA